MAFSYKEILDHFKATDWKTLQYKKDGVAVFGLYNKGAFITEGTLLELSNQAKSPNTSRQSSQKAADL